MIPPLMYQDVKDLPYVLQDYLRQLRNSIQSTVGAIPWTSVSKSGSNLTELTTHNHNDTANKQGGSGTEFYHLTAAQNGVVAGLGAGTYTPSLTNVANLDASTAYQCQYMKVGATVTVSGRVDIDPTLAATTTQLGISLPVASNLGASENCGGTAFASGIAAQGAAIRGDAANDRAELIYKSSDVTNQPMYFVFTYTVI